jgi:pimeloyl-ACP methyl ester carboxylesterase
MNRSVDLHRLIELVGVPIHHDSVNAETIKTTYLSAGQGDPVILLHGNISYGINWYPVIGPLSSRFRVIAPDIVGYGESDKPPASYDSHYYCSWLSDLMDALDLQKANIVGHSQGGAIALHYALDYPERVEKLVIVDSGGLGRLESVGVMFALIWYVLCPSRKTSLRIWKYSLHKSEKSIGLKALREYGVEVSRMPGARRAPLLGGKVGSRIPPEQLGNISQETLLIWGEQDNYYSVSQAEDAHKSIPGSQIRIISNSGHNPFYDQPKEFNNVLMRFLLSEYQG